MSALMNPSPAQKSVLSYLGPLTPEQRAAVQALVGQGIDAKTARAIVLGYAGVRKADTDAERPSYAEAYLAHAKATLPTWQHQQLHVQARAIAGGHASAEARQAPGPKTANLQELDLLKHRMAYLDQEVAKQSMLSSEAHVPVPLGADGGKRKKVPVVLSAEDHLIAEAYGLVAKADFDEKLHPRASNGEFADAGAPPVKSDVIGHTQSGKEVHDWHNAKHTAYSNFTQQDHKDAAKIQGASSTYQSAARKREHLALAKKLAPDAEPERGIYANARTSSGKRIYEDTTATHSTYKHFTGQDHYDAAQHHNSGLKEAEQEKGSQYAIDKRARVEGHMQKAQAMLQPEGVAHLPEAQEKALSGYTGHDRRGSNHDVLNNALEGKQQGSAEDHAKSLENARHLNDAITNSPLKEAKTFYRGTDMPQDVQVGQIIKTPRLLSVSTSSEIAERFATEESYARAAPEHPAVLTIHAPAGTPALDVNKHFFGVHAHEKEHILGSNQAFRVTSVSTVNGIRQVALDAVEAAAKAWRNRVTKSAAQTFRRHLPHPGAARDRMTSDAGFRIVVMDKEPTQEMDYAQAAYSLVSKTDFDESQHPRASNGQFGQGASGEHLRAANAHARRASAHLASAQDALAAGDDISFAHHMKMAQQSHALNRASLAQAAAAATAVKKADDDALAYAQAAYGFVAKAFDESLHPRAADGKFGEGGATARAGDVPFADPKDVKEVKPRGPRQKPIPFASPKDVHAVRSKASKPAANQDSERQAKAPAARQKLTQSATQIGQTQSGKQVFAGVKANHSANADFTRQDHADAAQLHHNAAQQDLHLSSAGGTKPVTRAQSAQAQASHGRAFAADKNKSDNAASDARAEAQKIGTTQSGKSIYADDAASHRRYKGYTSQDHLQAAEAHADRFEAALAKGDSYRASRHLSMAKGHIKRAQLTVAKAAEDPAVLPYAQAAYDLQAPAEAAQPDAGKVPAAALDLMRANRLVAGMDAEMAAGAQSPEEARRRASRALQDRPGLYNHIGTTPQTDRLNGLMLDLGAGAARFPGYIGLDLGTFGDYGNAIHDINLGLGEFPDGSVKAVRLVNSLHNILDDDGQERDPTPLLNEIQRVMCEGGILTYVGPEPLFEGDNTWPVPGLLLMGESGVPASEAEGGAGAVRQVFERVPPRVPAYHGADADFAPAGPMPIDVALAMAAMNVAPARLAMANLVHKTANRVVRIAKTDPAKQIVYGVVLDGGGNPDLQGDVLTHEDIEAAAHGYLGTSRVIGSEHGAPIQAHPVESFIAPQELTFDGPGGRSVVPKGSWVLGVKITDPEQWAQARDGGYNSFSVGGFGVREDLQPA